MENPLTKSDLTDTKEIFGDISPAELSPLVLAYVGDAYFSLYVRRRLLNIERHKVNRLNRLGAKMVSAVWQSRAYYALCREKFFSEREQDIFRRGRNAKSHAPRSATVA